VAGEERLSGGRRLGWGRWPELLGRRSLALLDSLRELAANGQRRREDRELNRAPVDLVGVVAY
jgi:hypothetical protein